MSLIILKIILIIILIRLIALEIWHLFIIFYDKAAKDIVMKISKNPEQYIREIHMNKFMYNMIIFYILIKILIALFNGNINGNIIIS